MIQIEIVTKENCPKCDYIKGLFARNVVMVNYNFINYKLIPPDVIKKHNITVTPTILVRNKNSGEILLKIDKGMTMENIRKVIKQETGIEI